MTDSRLEARAHVARQLVKHGVLSPVEALCVAVWPSERVADLLGGLPRVPVLHGTLASYKTHRCGCGRCRAVKRECDRVGWHDRKKEAA